MKTRLLLTTLIVGTAVSSLMAQDGRPQQGRPPGNRQQFNQQGGAGGSENGGPGMQGGQRPPSIPVVETLDTNKNRVIDAEEITNATASLKKLDKNGDGKLTPDEFMPPRPSGQGQGPGRAPQGQSGTGGQRPQRGSGGPSPQGQQ